MTERVRMGLTTFRNLREFLRRLRPGRRMVRRGLLLAAGLLVLSLVAYFLLLPRFRGTPPAVPPSPGLQAKSLDSWTFDPDTGVFQVVTAGGTILRSNPTVDEAEADPTAKGISRMSLLSQLVIRYADADARISTLTSYASALDRHDIPLGAVVDGNTVRCVYRFPTGKAAENLFIRIPVEYTFSDWGVDVTIPADGIEENEEYKLIDLAVLPFFAAGTGTEAGTTLVPDGSGALMQWNDPRPGLQEYSEPVYARDPALKTRVQLEVGQDIRLPAFGLMRQGTAVLALAEEGEALSSVTAWLNGMNTAYNNAFFTFRYREIDTITLNELGWNERSIPMVSARPVSVPAFRVRYIVLEGDDADLGGLAAAHRQNLQQRYGLAPLEPRGDTPLYLDLQMSVRRIRPVLGLPMTVVEPLTTFDQAADILDAFRTETGAPLVARLNGWLPGGPYADIPRGVAFERAVGGAAGFRRFSGWLASQSDLAVYPAADLVHGYQDGNGFVGMFQGNRDITGALSLQFDFLASSGAKNYRIAPWHLLTPGFSVAALDRFLGTAGRLADAGMAGLALDGIGSMVYADTYHSFLNPLVGRIPSDRQQTAGLWQWALASARDTAGGVLVEGGNAYVLPFVDHVVGIPMASSRFLASRETVPYYQMVASGLVRTASTPVNFAVDPDRFWLQCLETGTFPMYSLTYAESSLVKATRLNHLDNGEYTLWLDSAARNYDLYREAFAAVGGRAILDRTVLPDDVVQVDFSGGLRLVVDYGAGTFRLEGGDAP